MRLGSSQTRTFIAGIANVGVSGPTVEIDTNTGQLGIVLSSAGYKQDIVPMGIQSEGVLKLRPVTFAYKDDTQGVRRFGLIAEEVASVYPETRDSCGHRRGASGQVSGVDSHAPERAAAAVAGDRASGAGARTPASFPLTGTRVVPRPLPLGVKPLEDRQTTGAPDPRIATSTGRRNHPVTPGPGSNPLCARAVVAGGA
jgi:hypothetical protein